MGEELNIYCDESCHLEHDRQVIMILGALWCPRTQARTIAEEIRAIKKSHGLSPDFEIKWIKVSPGKKDFYTALVDYFFKTADLHLRTLIVPDKSKLHHEQFDQDHDTWYYKMYFHLLKAILAPLGKHFIYLDIKDSRSGLRVKHLHEVLSSSQHDFKNEIIQRIQPVRSHEVEQVQLADLLIGAISYINRGLHGNSGKNAVVDRMRLLSGYSLTKTTLLREEKLNVFSWTPRSVEG